jgi:3-oxoadipate CoA-transferase alpha subunit
MNKIVPSVEQAVADIPDGATIMIGGFGAAGLPLNLTRALIAKGTKDLTVICNAITEFFELVEAKRVKKAITSYVGIPRSIMPVNPLEEQYRAGEVELELVPEGTLAERIRAAGVGLAGFYTPVGVGTPVEQGKETKVFNGKKYILETALHADFALTKGYHGDRFGNLIYRKVARNQNPIMAMASNVTIAEVEEIVEVGQLDPDIIVTPGIFVDRVVQAKKVTREFVIHY